jgi:copper chaperone CopZ
VAAESVERFLDGLVRRLETLVEAVPTDVDEEAEPTPDPEEESSGVALREVFVPVERLGRRPGGAAGVAHRLASISGVTRAEVDPATGLAEVEYDPAYCNLQRLQDELEDDGPAPTDG